MSTQKYDDHVYIKDGKIMFRNSKTVFYDSYLPNKKVYEQIESFLETDPENIAISNIISEAVKAATDCSHFYHYRISPPKDSKLKVMLSDPLYIEFENYIKGLDIYNEILEKRLEKQRKIIKRKEEARDKKIVEQNLHYFLAIEKRKRLLNSARKYKH